MRAGPPAALALPQHPQHRLRQRPRRVGTRGADALDASVGGIGGCPFAPAATGNIATEDLLYLLHRSGVRTGIDPDALMRVLPDLEVELGHQVSGQLGRAGWFPPAVVVS